MRTLSLLGIGVVALGLVAVAAVRTTSTTAGPAPRTGVALDEAGPPGARPTFRGERVHPEETAPSVETLDPRQPQAPVPVVPSVAPPDVAPAAARRSIPSEPALVGAEGSLARDPREPLAVGTPLFLLGRLDARSRGSALPAVPWSLHAAPAAATAAPPPHCPDSPGSPENACCNTAFPLKYGTYDFVPVPTASHGWQAGRGFHVAYSARQQGETETEVSENVGMFVFELDPAPSGRRRALVFGSGYGDYDVATFGASCDADLVEEIITQELGYSISRTDLTFVAPHGHFDHINSEFLSDLVGRGFGLTSIYFHTSDWNLTRTETCSRTNREYFHGGYPSIAGMNWQGLEDQLAPLGPGEVSRLRFSSPLGTIRFVTTPGHTCGTLDLILDFGSPSVSIAVRGSIVTAPLGLHLLYDIPPHGNVLLPQGPCETWSCR